MTDPVTALRAVAKTPDDAQSQIVGSLSRQGFAEMPDVLPRALLEELQTCYRQEYASMSDAALRETCLEVGDKRYFITVELSGPFADPLLYANPRILPVVRELLGNDVVLDSLTSVCAFPGAQDQHIHVDHPPLFPSQGLSAMLPPYALQVGIPLVDLNPRVGTTGVWLGSHRRPPVEHGAPKNYDDAFLPFPTAGSAYIMDYRLLHGGTANVSADVRPLLYLLYVRPWFTDRRNFSKQPKIIASREFLGTVPPECQPLFSCLPTTGLTGRPFRPSA